MKARAFLNFSFSPFGKRAVCFFGIFLSVMIVVQTANAAVDVQDGEDTRQLVKQADKLTRQNKIAEAEIILRRAVELNQKDSKIKLKLSYVLLKKRNFAEAYSTALTVAQNEPKNARAFALLGMALLDLGRFDEANKVLINAYLLDNDESLAWFGAGMLDFYSNRIEQGLTKLERACFLSPSDPDYLFSTAQVMARAEDFLRASETYQRFLDVAPIADSDRRARIKGLIDFLRYIGGKQKLYLTDGNLRQSTVNFELRSMRPVIEVGIGDKKEKLRFVLDTGSGISVISNATAEKLKIKSVARGGSARAVGGDGKFEIVYGFLNSIRIGDAKIRNVPVYIRDFQPNKEDIDGYIGLSLISKFLTTVDYGNKTFTLRRKDRESAKEFESESLSLPLRLTSSGFLSGEVQIEGINNPLNFIVDTGASISVISQELAETGEMNKFLTTEKMRVYGAAGITENVNSFLLPSVSFGKHTREKIKAIALDLDIINEASGFEQAGIIGGNFLANYRVTFDFQNSKVVFVPVAVK